MQIGRRQFIATLAAAIVAPHLPAIEVLPLTPPLSPFWSSTLTPATGVLTFEMLQQAIDNISGSIGNDRLIVLPPWYDSMVRRLLEADALRCPRTLPAHD